MAKKTKKIAIVTDSVACIPQNLVKKYGIKVVPLYVNVEGKSYRESLEIEQDKVYEKLLEGKPITTSTPTIKDFVELYSDIKEREDPDVIYSIHLAAELSGTLDRAITSAKTLKDIRIKPIDSKRAAISQGLIAIAAAEAAKRGAGEEEIDSIIRDMCDSSFFYATFDNFEYVVRGGRAPFLAGFVKRIMVLKPIISFNEAGGLGLKKFCMNKRNAIKEVYNLIKRDLIRTGMESCLIGTCYGNDPGPAEMLKDMMKADTDIEVRDFVITKMTSVMAAHTGPGIWGLAVCPAFVSKL